MSVSESIRRMTALLMGRAHLEIVRNDLRLQERVPIAALTQHQAVNHLAWLAKKLGFEPKSVIDAGASDGRWTRAALKYFPDARYLLVEPLVRHEQSLAELERECPNVRCYRGVVSSRRQLVRFNAYGHTSSIYGDVGGRPFGTSEDVMATTLDDVIREKGFPGPELIKLDIEGSELEALRGAPGALASAQLVEMEVSLLPFKKDLVLFGDLVSFMSENGFRVLDVFGVHGRPLDGLPAQCECVFIRKETVLIQDYRWGDGLVWS